MTLSQVLRESFFLYFWLRIFIHKAYIFVKKLAKRKKIAYFNDFLLKKFVGIKFFLYFCGSYHIAQYLVRVLAYT